MHESVITTNSFLKPTSRDVGFSFGAPPYADHPLWRTPRGSSPNEGPLATIGYGRDGPIVERSAVSDQMFRRYPRGSHLLLLAATLSGTVTRPKWRGIVNSLAAWHGRPHPRSSAKCQRTPDTLNSRAPNGSSRPGSSHCEELNGLCGYRRPLRFGAQWGPRWCWRKALMLASKTRACRR